MDDLMDPRERLMLDNAAPPELLEAAKAKSPARKKKPPKLAVIHQDGCTGCEVCIDYCPVENCIIKVPGPDFADLFPVVQVVNDLCIGCSLCEQNCPWETIDMVNFAEWDKQQAELLALVAAES